MKLLKDVLTEEKCHEILHLVKDMLGDREADVVVIVFDENERRNFGTGCLQCSAEALFETASDISARANETHNHHVELAN